MRKPLWESLRGWRERWPVVRSSLTLRCDGEGHAWQDCGLIDSQTGQPRARSACGVLRYVVVGALCSSGLNLLAKLEPVHLRIVGRALASEACERGDRGGATGTSD